MENENSEIIDFSFLSDESVEKHFADINISLLSGKHIDNRDYTMFSVLEDFVDHWKFYYAQLYQLNLIADLLDGNKCFYLEFRETGKGKMSDPKRHKELTELQTLIGLMLLDMYLQKYFEEEKTITWNDLQVQILESDHQEAYQRILFNDVRDSYDEKEWNEVKGKFTRTIDSFERLGWVEKQSGKNEDIILEIRPAIYRLAKIYEKELQDFPSFSQKLKKNETL